jgi:hypothetical protein
VFSGLTCEKDLISNVSYSKLFPWLTCDESTATITLSVTFLVIFVVGIPVTIKKFVFFFLNFFFYKNSCCLVLCCIDLAKHIAILRLSILCRLYLKTIAVEFRLDLKLFCLAEEPCWLLV